MLLHKFDWRASSATALDGEVEAARVELNVGAFCLFSLSVRDLSSFVDVVNSFILWRVSDKYNKIADRAVTRMSCNAGWHTMHRQCRNLSLTTVRARFDTGTNAIIVAGGDNRWRLPANR